MARRSLLNEADRKRFFEAPDDEASLIRLYSLSDVDRDFVLSKRGARNQLGMAVQLGLLRYPGFGLRLENEPPAPLIQFLARQIGAPWPVFQDYARRDTTRREHFREASAHLGLRPCTIADRRDLLDCATNEAMSTDKGSTIIMALLQRLRDRRIVLPAPARIERIAVGGRASARRLAADAMIVDIDATKTVRIDGLLVNDPALKRTPIAWLRDWAEAPKASNLAAILERLAYVRAFELDPKMTERVSEWRFRQLAREGAAAPAFLLDEYGPRRRRATLVAQLLDLETRLSDAAIAMFVRLILGLFTKARKSLERRYQATAKEVADLMRMLSSTIDVLAQARDAKHDPFEALDSAIGWKRLLAAKPKAAELGRKADEDPLIKACERYMTVRRFAPRFLESFTFRASSDKDALLCALDLLKRLNREPHRPMPEKPPLSFLPKAWRRLVVKDGGVDRRLYEVATLAVLCRRLGSGDIWIEGTRNFQQFDRYLLAKADVPKNATALAVPTECEDYLQQRTHLLDWRLRRLANALRHERLAGVILRNGVLHVSPTQAITPPEAERLNRALDRLMPRVRITELLHEVCRRTGFTHAFTDLRSGKPVDNENALLAAILADGTNLGLERMAHASQGVTKAQLAWIHTWHLREETYRAALGAIINAHHAEPMAAIWGAGATSSSDGQFFRAGRRGAGFGDINAKYGIDPGMLFYTHISDQYGPFHGKVLSATMSEAPHVLDGLLHHGTSLTIKEHYTDTGGASDHVFALCHLLGFRFVPRLRDFQDYRLGVVEKPAAYKGIESLFGRPIRIDVIQEHWDEIIRLAASIKAGTAAPSVILKKLAAFPRQNRLDFALSELGRLERTIFMLDWLESPELRRRCHAGLNKGESRHALDQAVFIHKQGRFADRTFENQSYRASGLNLVTAAIVYWNTVYLWRAVDHLRCMGAAAPNDLLQHAAPLGWNHVSLTGDYLWSQANTPHDGFRTLSILDEAA
ncbi:MAG TPA: Tn3 family transposase [Hyphomicrobium sp.]